MLQEQLQKVAKHLQEVQAQNDVFVEQGRRAYRMGFERRANPLNLPTQRVLWERGYDLEAQKFGEMMNRWKNS